MIYSDYRELWYIIRGCRLRHISVLGCRLKRKNMVPKTRTQCEGKGM